MHEIKLPQLGQSVEEAAIVQWFKKEGDSVSKGERLFSVQTDKAEIECESTADGVLRKILLPTDVEVPVMTVVALVGAADEPLPDLGQYAAAAAQPAVAADATASAEPKLEPAPARNVASPSAPSAVSETAGQAPVSPRARRRAQELGIDPAMAAGSGPAGRVMESDVEALAAELDSTRITPVARQMATQRGLDVRGLRGSGPGGKITKADIEAAAKPAPEPAYAEKTTPGEVRRVPLTAMRRIIAKRMAESMFSAPHYYVTIEADMTEAAAFRKALQSFKLSFNDLILYATAKAIRKFPAVNARWAGDAIEEVQDINLGFAVALPAGLVVPVIRRVDTKTLEEIHLETMTLAGKARHGKLTPDDYSDNTFTVSNLGSFGVDEFTAIINQPDSAILAVGQIKDRPVAIDGGVFVRPIAKLTLSSDHRVIDGAVAAQFMGALRDLLESAEF